MKKQELEQQQQQLGTIMAEGMGEGVHPLERPEVPMKIKVGCHEGRARGDYEDQGGSVARNWREDRPSGRSRVTIFTGLTIVTGVLCRLLTPVPDS